MKTVYDGVAVLDRQGEAVVKLPRYFEALNHAYRYQLTAIGAPGPNLHILREIQANQFAIGGGTMGMRVSWQVTGIRQDEWARKNPAPVEVDKTAEEREDYINRENR